ncbi:hypothetical protein AD998_00955 [bacterium 336/3]|nr:hypothetical protein AD998_00955 [bacterium 336/3]
MKLLYFSLLLLWGCDKAKNEEIKTVSLDSAKYDGMYLGSNYEIAGTYHSSYFLLTICHYIRYENYEDWWSARYSTKGEDYYKKTKESKSVIYYEIINLSAAFKPKKLGKLYFSKLNFENGERVIYTSDTTSNGFYFQIAKQNFISYKSNLEGVLVSKLVNSSLDSFCVEKEHKPECFYGIYKDVVEVPYRIITDEEIKDPTTKVKNEEFMRSISSYQAKK